MLHQKPKKKPIHPNKKYRNPTRSEHSSYQPDNPLTRYVERVCGVNSAGKKL